MGHGSSEGHTDEEKLFWWAWGTGGPFRSAIDSEIIILTDKGTNMSQKLVFAILVLVVVLAALLAYTQYNMLVPQ